MELIEKYINSLMEESTPDCPIWNIEKIRSGRKAEWDYIDGCMIKGFLEFYEKRGDRKFLDFSSNYVSYRVKEDGTILGYSPEEYNVDNVNGAKNLLTLYRLTGEEKYKKAAGKVFEQLKTQPRTKEGNFWHKLIYPNQVWLDGLYMALPFYLEYANLFMNEEEKAAAYEDIYGQFFMVEDNMKDAETGLYYHAYDSSREMFWCDKQTGLSKNFWLRSLGWFGMAMLDSLMLFTDKESASYKRLSNMFKSFIDALLKVQSESGMWYQLPVYPKLEGNYLETSGSAIFAYCLKKGYKAGILSKECYDAGEKAFADICRRYLVEKDGKMGLGGICLVAGLGGKQMRDGTCEYYLSEPIVNDDAKGTAPFVLAYLY